MRGTVVSVPNSSYKLIWRAGSVESSCQPEGGRLWFIRTPNQTLWEMLQLPQQDSCPLPEPGPAQHHTHLICDTLLHTCTDTRACLLGYA